MFNSSYTHMKKEGLRAAPCVMIDIPLIRQSHDFTCGIACTQSILRYLGYDFDTMEDTLMKELHVSKEYGTSPCEIIAYLNEVAYQKEKKTKIKAIFKERMSIDDLTLRLDMQRPMICPIQAWYSDELGENELKHDYSTEYNCSHYVIAIGYDAERIYFMDPLITGNYTYIPINEFVSRWHGELGGTKYEHFGIEVKVERPEYNPHIFYKIL